jgi:hypothetical protein
LAGGPVSDRGRRPAAGQRCGDRLADYGAELEAVAGEAREHPSPPERLDDEALALGDAVEARSGVERAVALEVDQAGSGQRQRLAEVGLGRLALAIRLATQGESVIAHFEARAVHRRHGVEAAARRLELVEHHRRGAPSRQRVGWRLEVERDLA